LHLIGFNLLYYPARFKSWIFLVGMLGGCGHS
jgi:hypothetical protein